MKQVIGLYLFAFGLIIVLTGLAGVFAIFVMDPVVPAVLPMSLLTVAVGGAMLLVSRRIQKSIPKAEPGRDRGYLCGKPEQRELNGNTYTVLYKPEGKGEGGGNSSLRVSATAESPATMRFKPETWFDRLGKQWGIARELQTGDRSFDHAVYVRTGSEGFTERYLADAAKRMAIVELLDMGFEEIRLNRESVEAVWPSFNPGNSDRPRLTHDAAEHLFTLADDLPAEDPDEAFLGTSWSGLWNALLWLVAGAFAATVVFAFTYPPLRTGTLLLSGLLAFIFIYPAFGFISALLLRGTSTSHDRWSILMGGSLVLLGLGSLGGVATLNGWADTAQPTEHVMKVTSKRISKGEGSRSYHAIVPAWDRPGDIVDLGVSRDAYERIIPGRTRYKVTTSPGLLHIEWIKAKELQW